MDNNGSNNGIPIVKINQLTKRLNLELSGLALLLVEFIIVMVSIILDWLASINSSRTAEEIIRMNARLGIGLFILLLIVVLIIVFVVTVVSRKKYIDTLVKINPQVTYKKPSTLAIICVCIPLNIIVLVGIILLL